MVQWYTYMRYKGVIHLHGLQEDGPPSGLHPAKGLLYNATGPGMMGVEALGCLIRYWPPVGSDEGERVLEAWVPSICQDEMPWRRIEWPLVQWVVPEHSGVMH